MKNNMITEKLEKSAGRFVFMQSAVGGEQEETLPGGGFHGGEQEETLPGGGFHGSGQEEMLPGD